MKQNTKLILQGRPISLQDIELIRNLLNTNPSWHRTRLSKELCYLWNWRRTTGELKDIACRSLLRKLDKLGYISLPPQLHKSNNASQKNSIQPMFHSRESINSTLNSLFPVNVQVVEKGYELKLFKYFISAYHYLGWSGTVGENLKYLIFDLMGRPLGCLMFGAAAWKVKPRDNYIGWDTELRVKNLSLIANNNRFLLLPWVNVPHLASHILGKICRRINQDWQKKYNHSIYLIETFVEKERFRGTCYKAANTHNTHNTHNTFKTFKTA